MENTNETNNIFQNPQFNMQEEQNVTEPQNNEVSFNYNESYNNQDAPVVNESNQPVQAPKKPAGKIILTVVIILVVLAGAACLLSMLLKSDYEKAEDAINKTLEADSYTMSIDFESDNNDLNAILSGLSNFEIGKMYFNRNDGVKFESFLFDSTDVFITTDKDGNAYISLAEDGEADTAVLDSDKKYDMKSKEHNDIKKTVDDLFDELEKELNKEDIKVSDYYNSKELRAAFVKVLEVKSMKNYSEIQKEDGTYTITFDIEKFIRFAVDTIKPAFTDDAIDELEELSDMTIDEMIDELVDEIDEVIEDAKFEVVIKTEKKKATEITISIPSLKAKITFEFKNIDSTEINVPAFVEDSYDYAEKIDYEDLASLIYGF